MKNYRWLLGLIIGVLLVAGMIYAAVMQINSQFQRSVDRVVNPFEEANSRLGTQVSDLLHPTPTIIPDPVTIIHEVRSLARLETIQYSVEKVITAETGQGELKFLFGDKLLFVAHGTVLAGVDLAKLQPEDVWVKDKVLHLRLPGPDIFSSALDNQKSYIYDRQTGLLSKGEPTLETKARQAAEDEIRKAALADGILDYARQNAESFLSGMLRRLGYPEVIFEPLAD